MGALNASSWKDVPVFVTGCTGLLGSWLTTLLVQKGAQVTGLVRDWVPQSLLLTSDVLNQVNVVRGQVEDFDLLERTINEYEVGVVFHLAAQTIVGTANRNPRSTFDTNIKGTWNLLEACRRVPTVRALVIASSDKAYGAQPILPYEETLGLAGRYPYDVSKVCADLIAQSYYATYQLPVCVTRCGNLYGGGDLNFNRLVPGTIRSLIYRERPRLRSDGTFTRDYFYVKDAAAALVSLAEQMNENAILGEAFNFSNETPISAADMVRKIAIFMGCEAIEPIILGTSQNEIPHQYLSARKAMKLLGWRASYTLEEGLQDTIEWYRAFFGRKR